MFEKTGNKKRATCLATLLQNELYGDVAAMLQNKLHVFCAVLDL